MNLGYNARDIVEENEPYKLRNTYPNEFKKHSKGESQH